MSKKYWAIVDRDNQVVGEWIGKCFCIPSYHFDEAKRVALWKKIPSFKILGLEAARQLKPSPLSRKIW